MKQIRFCLFCVFAFILIYNANAQDFSVLSPSTEIIETVYDNRSIGMGKTAITTANSSSAIFSNPALLSSLSDGQFQIGGKLLYGMVSDGRASELYDSYDVSYTPFPNRSYFGLAIPYSYDNQLRFVLGMAYQRNEGVRINEEVVSLEERWSETRGTTVKTRITRTSTAWTRGQLSTLVPGISFNYDDSIYLGITLNRTYGEILGNVETKSTDQQVELEIEREQSAVYFRIGPLAEVTPTLSIGLTYRSEFEWELGKQSQNDMKKGILIPKEILRLKN